MKHDAKLSLLTGLFTGLFMLIVFVVVDNTGITLFSGQTISSYIAVGLLGGLSAWLAQYVAKKFL